MQELKNRKLWFFFALGIMLVAGVCIWKAGSEEKTAYANGRVVERIIPQLEWRSRG